MRNLYHSQSFAFYKGVALAGLLFSMLLAACIAAPSGAPPTPDTTGPTITQVTASSKGFVKSDCTPTAITVTATISDPADVADVLLWYRVGDSQPLTSVAATSADDSHYSVSVKGTEVPGSDYGVWEFYLTADDGLGNQSQSPTDTTVQLLPCVN